MSELAAHRQRALIAAAAQHQRAADTVADVHQEEVVAVGAGAELAERQRAHLLHQTEARREICRSIQGRSACSDQCRFGDRRTRLGASTTPGVLTRTTHGRLT